mgnify:CR=1 FL=1
MRRYKEIPILKDSVIKPKKRFYSTTRYPVIPLSISDIYVVTQQYDRYDLLAYQYYKDKSLWWIISIANSHLIQVSLYTPVGIQLRIPTNTSEIISSYNKLNQ